MELCGNLNILWHFPSPKIPLKTDLFQSCGHSWVYQIYWHIECSNFVVSSFRIWKPPLALFVVMLPKAYLTSHSRMSVSRWVIIPSWLSGSWRCFLFVWQEWNFWVFWVIFSFFEKPLYHFPQWLYQFTFSLTVNEESIFFTPSPAFIGFRVFDHSHSDQHEMVPHCGFDLHFSDNEWCWASFHVFGSHLYVFFGEMSV